MQLNHSTGFTGHQHDIDLGVIDMRGRIYDPLAGRFMSPDPITQAPFWSQGLNRYSYVFNNPVNNTDPSGFMTGSDFAVPGAMVTLASPLLAAGGLGGIGGGLSLATGMASLPGGARASRVSAGAAPTAAPTSSGSGQGAPHAAAQNKRGVGPAMPATPGDLPGSPAPKGPGNMPSPQLAQSIPVPAPAPLPLPPYQLRSRGRT